VAHPCNPSYSGGRDQEITVQSQPRQTVLQTLSGKKKAITKKRADGVAQGVGPKFKPQYLKKQKKKKMRKSSHGIPEICLSLLALYINPFPWN
jgi:hypothetical protein